MIKGYQDEYVELVDGSRDFCIGYATAYDNTCGLASCFVECAGAGGSQVGEGFQIWPEWGEGTFDALSDDELSST